MFDLSYGNMHTPGLTSFGQGADVGDHREYRAQRRYFPKLRVSPQRRPVATFLGLSWIHPICLKIHVLVISI